MSILTVRERGIFLLLKDGLCTLDIAKKLNISEKTIRNHISNVICKLGVLNRLQAFLLLVNIGEI